MDSQPSEPFGFLQLLANCVQELSELLFCLGTSSPLNDVSRAVEINDVVKDVGTAGRLSGT